MPSQAVPRPAFESFGWAGPRCGPASSLQLVSGFTEVRTHRQQGLYGGRDIPRLAVTLTLPGKDGATLKVGGEVALIPGDLPQACSLDAFKEVT
jgi:hypothetical protein